MKNKKMFMARTEKFAVIQEQIADTEGGARKPRRAEDQRRMMLPNEAKRKFGAR